MDKDTAKRLREKIRASKPITRNEWAALQAYVEGNKGKAGKPPNPLPEPIFSDGPLIDSITNGVSTKTPDAAPAAGVFSDGGPSELPPLPVISPSEAAPVQGAPPPPNSGAPQTGVPTIQPPAATAQLDQSMVKGAIGAFYTDQLTTWNKEILKRGGAPCPEALIKLGAECVGYLCEKYLVKYVGDDIGAVIGAGLPVGYCYMADQQIEDKRKAEEAKIPTPPKTPTVVYAPPPEVWTG
jgi:hypothetical protein